MEIESSILHTAGLMMHQSHAALQRGEVVQRGLGEDLSWAGSGDASPVQPVSFHHVLSSGIE